jgi:Fic family protein
MDEKITLVSDIQNLIKSKLKDIDEFNAIWKQQENIHPEKFLRELKDLSTVQSVGSSTRIEGSSLSDEEVKDLIANLDINKLTGRDSQEVVGYYEALDLIFENFDLIFLTEAYIKQLHFVLLKHSSKDICHHGKYKSLSNKVVAKYSDGTNKVIFNTTEPYLVSKEMEELLCWTNARLANNMVHPLIVVSAFVYEFLSIHPFQDGNGRLSRLLTNLLMIKLGYSFIRYISFEHVIEERKKEYYQNLMECQRHRYCPEENISRWILFFLDAVEDTIFKLQTKLIAAQTLSVNRNLSRNQLQILDLIQASQGLKFVEIHKKLSGIPAQTIKSALARLVDQNLIHRNGRGRGTWYTAV